MRILLTTNLSLLLLSTPLFGQSFERPETIVIPVSSLGEISTVSKQNLQNTLEDELKSHFRLVPQEKFEEVLEKLFQELDYEECTEDQCVLRVQEMLQVENVFHLQLISKGSDTRLSLSWRTLVEKRKETDFCEGCKKKELNLMIGELVNKLVRVKDDVVKEKTIVKERKVEKVIHTKQWTKQLGTSSNDSGTGVILDSLNNIYVTGSTEGELNGNTNSGEDDVFLIKYTLNGVKQWTQQLGTSSIDRGFGVTVDSSDNTYVMGYTLGGIDKNINSGNDCAFPPCTDIFLLKYTPDGIKQWAQQFGTSKQDSGSGMTVDSSNNIYITGNTRGELDGNNFLGGYDIFIVKYNSGGTRKWTQQMGGYPFEDTNDVGHGVTVDSSNNIYVTGWTEGGLDGNINSGEYDMFLLKYNSDGVKQWTQQLGTALNDIGFRVTADLSDNIYVTGTTDGGLDGNFNSGGYDIFLVKYNSSGLKKWTQQLGTSSDDLGTDLRVDSSDNIYLTGTTEGGLDGNTNSGKKDIFLVKYNSDGVKQWTQQLGTSSNDWATGMKLDSSDNIYLTGTTEGGFDGNTNSGKKDIFLVKFSPDGVSQ